ncbi:MAG: beta-lactamase family protein [Candidatus Dormibacteraeota bacterium]|nr:beta-lactamase family protein [Candidatus Dormibacteraeota bacterium]
MTEMRDVLEPYVRDGTLPGAVALVAHLDSVTVEAVGCVDAEGSAPMGRESIFRLASITKPITAAAVMMLIQDGKLGFEDPIAQWLPELDSPMVVRTPASPVDDTTPVSRPITVLDLLTSRAGWGFPSDFSLPAVHLLFTVQTDGREVQLRPDPDEWLARLSRIPLLYQPGQAWLYDTCSDLQGILIARVTNQSLPDFLAERLFEPLGMTDTSFVVPAAKRNRFTSYYRPTTNGGIELADATDGQWASPPAFPAGSGGLVGTVEDWYRFGRMILNRGSVNDRQLLSPQSVQQMTTNHLTQSQREIGRLFLEGQGWGFGGCVDIEAREPWNVPGRYGWVGGTGTTAHIIPSTGSVAILLTQVAATGPIPPALMRDFWRYAAVPRDQ